MTNFSQVIKYKQIEQNKLNKDIEQFLQSGGIITECPPFQVSDSRRVNDQSVGSLYG